MPHPAPKTGRWSKDCWDDIVLQKLNENFRIINFVVVCWKFVCKKNGFTLTVEFACLCESGKRLSTECAWYVEHTHAHTHTVIYISERYCRSCGSRYSLHMSTCKCNVPRWHSLIHTHTHTNLLSHIIATLYIFFYLALFFLFLCL